MAEQEKPELNLLQYLVIRGKQDALWEKAFCIEYGISKDGMRTVMHTKDEWDKMFADMKNRPTRYSNAKPDPLKNFVVPRLNGRIVHPRNLPKRMGKLR